MFRSNSDFFRPIFFAFAFFFAFFDKDFVPFKQKKVDAS